MIMVDQKTIDLERLRDFEVFQGLMTREMQIIHEVSTLISFSGGDNILNQSDLSMDLFIVVKGRLSVNMVYSSTREKRLQKIAELKPGDIFGEIGFLEGKRRSASITAMEAGQVLKMDGLKVHEIFEINQHMGYIMMRNIALVLARRLVDINYQLRNQSY
jgi:CRP-like cAMP-binding protein